MRRHTQRHIRVEMAALIAAFAVIAPILVFTFPG